MNKMIKEDIYNISQTAILLGFKNKNFLITGATGMIGQSLVHSLLFVTDSNNIIVLGKDIDDVKNTFKTNDVRCLTFDELDEIDYDIDYIIHLASPTNSAFLKNKPVETIDFIYNSTKKVLDFALSHRSAVLYISSMEAYGIIHDSRKRDENELGNIPLQSTRSSYSESKRICELLCYSYYKEFGLSVRCARLAQTFGASTPLTDPRIFGYIARCVVNNENIILKTDGSSIGNYCYLSDTINGFFYILSKGIDGETYNIVGDEKCRCTILDMAKMVARDISQGCIEVQIELSSNNDYPNPTFLNMSNKKLKELGWNPKFTLYDMYYRMIYGK